MNMSTGYTVAFRIIIVLVVVAVILYFANPASSHEGFQNVASSHQEGFQNVASHEGFQNVASHEGFQNTITLRPPNTSKSLFKESSNFKKDYAERKLVLEDRDDLLHMFNCISMTPGDLTNFGKTYKTMPMYVEPFEMLTKNFSEVKEDIVRRIIALKDRIQAPPNLASPPAPVLISGPIYALILQTPYYPDGRGGFVSLMNYNIETGYDNSTYNTAVTRDTPAILFTVYLIFPRHNRDGSPSPDISSVMVAKKLAPLLQHSTRDPLCFMKCAGDVNTFCGCRSIDKDAKTEVGGTAAPFQATCLGPADNSDKMNYANMYTINNRYIGFNPKPTTAATGVEGFVSEDEGAFGAGAVIFAKDVDAGTTLTGNVIEWPPENIGNAPWITQTPSVPMLNSNNKELLPKYIKNVASGPGEGNYVVWSNTSGRPWYWIPTGAFDKRKADVGGAVGWHTDRDTSCAIPGNKDAPSPRPYLAITLPKIIVLKSYSIEPRNNCCIEQVPTKWILWGSSDEKNWTEIDKREGIRWTQLGQAVSFDIKNNSSSFRTYKIEMFQGGYGAGVGCLHIGELRLFGAAIA